MVPMGLFQRGPARIRLDGAVVLVAGGARGIGARTACAARDRGAHVWIGDLDPDLAECAAAGAQCRRLDVTDPASWQSLVDEIVRVHGRIDVLVNNAGVGPTERLDILEATPESFDRVLGINLRGPYFLTQAVANQMLAQAQLDGAPRGIIVNVSSISAVTVSVNRGEYCISKAGVSMATRLWAARLAPEGILAYEVRPGIVATDMTAGVKDRYDALFEQGISPMPRWGQPSDVGGAVAALASGAMPYSTGDVINVDGGMHLPRL